MLPRAGRILKPVHDAWSQGAARMRVVARVAGWGLLLWTAVVAVPFAFLYPDEGLDRPACWALVAVPPLAILAMAWSGEALAVLGAALLGLLPALIACPELQGPRTSGPLPSLVVAVLLLGLVDAAFRPSARRAHPSGEGELRRLVRKPMALLDRLLLGLGAAWLALAWYLPGDGDSDEGRRAARVASAAACWVAVRVLPLRGPVPALDGSAGPDRWPLYVGRRVAWVGLLGGLLWLWRHLPGS